MIIRPDFKSSPNTEDWFCLAWMGMITEAGLGIIYYKFKKD